MLRTKQIGNLSNSARSFFLSGTRGGTADGGNACSCSEDETCISRRQQHTKNGTFAKKSPIIPPQNLPRVGALIKGDAVKLVGSHKGESVTTSLQQIASAPTSLVRSDRVSYANIDVIQKDTGHISPPIGTQILKAGISVVSHLSDVHKSDGVGVQAHPKSSSSISAEPNSVGNSYSSNKDRGDKSGFVKGFKHASSNRTVNSGQPTIISSSTQDKKKTFPQRSKVHSDCSASNLNARTSTPDMKYVNNSTEGLNKTPREMKKHAGVAPVFRQFGSGHVVESVSSILRQHKWGPATEKALGNLKFSMDAYQANQILKQLQDDSVAMSFFYWLKRQCGFKHDGHTYTTMVGILGRAKKFGTIKNLLDQMTMDGCKPNVVTYNRLIHSYGRANYLNEALNVFNKMQEVGCEPDRVTYCTLIDIHAKAGFLDVAMYMYQKMQEAGLSPDTFTYSVMINCLGKAGNLTAAHKLFCEMVDQGCVPSLVTYNIIIALQAKARNYETALNLYHDMQKAGFQPDKVTYSIVMEVLGHCGYLEEAESVFGEMERNNWVPDEPAYGLLVDLWGKAGNVEKAWGWYQAMVYAGLRPNVPTCNSLLSAFLRVHRLSDAYNLLQSMLGLGLNPSLQTYTLLLSCCTEARSPYDMGFCCELMAVTGHPAHAFLVSMPASGPDGQNVRDHVCKFLDMLHSEDRESKRGLVDSVVDFLHKSGLKEEAGSVWEVAVQKNVYPDAVREKSSSYWLINLHVMSEGTAVTALSRTLAWFRQQMLVSGVSPSRIDIVTGWGRRSRVTGSSMVRQAVQELLNMFSFPFLTENGNSGCFVGCGEPLNRWLLQSYVERMHLL